jgi:SAM-dependent methyltransferase
MIRILRFHWQLYLRTLAFVAAALVIAPHTGAPLRGLLRGAVVPAVFWCVSSLAVSWYVYDRSPLSGFRWLPRWLGRKPVRWLNLHAGLDDLTPLLPALFPRAEGRVLDIFDPAEMTEPSIGEARRAVHPPADGPRARHNALPVATASLDAAFLVFTAHELRRHASRVALFGELARALRAGGSILLVEHLRDWRNFLAFGPGFLHFLPERAWRSAASAARLRVRADFAMTPFVHVFVLERTV